MLLNDGWRGAKRVKPHTLQCSLRTLLNGWPKAHRLEHTHAQCVVGCPAGSDSISGHYWPYLPCVLVLVHQILNQGTKKKSREPTNNSLQSVRQKGNVQQFKIRAHTPRVMQFEKYFSPTVTDFPSVTQHLWLCVVDEFHMATLLCSMRHICKFGGHMISSSHSE